MTGPIRGHAKFSWPRQRRHARSVSMGGPMQIADRLKREHAVGDGTIKVWTQLAHNTLKSI